MSTPLKPVSEPPVVPRAGLRDGSDSRLFFAQVREDPELELTALAGHLDGPIVVVSSAGCTALSLVARGATEVIAVDSNRTQNHLVELKAAAVSALGSEAAVAFLGAAPATDRLSVYGRVRDALSVDARAHWDRRGVQVDRGVLGSGATERFLAVFARLIRRAVHSPATIDGLLACDTPADQRAFYDARWNTWRWRALFHLVLNRFVFKNVYDPGFFAHVETSSFAQYFLDTAGHVLADLPIESNYFLHFILAGRYPSGVAGGVPPYLDKIHDGAMQTVAQRLRLVDGTLTEYLKACPTSTVAAFSLSNICEWLDADQTDALFTEMARTARPGARLCFRNFVGWTEVPSRWRDRFMVDGPLSADLGPRDRSLCQRRIVVADIAEG